MKITTRIRQLAEAIGITAPAAAELVETVRRSDGLITPDYAMDDISQDETDVETEQAENAVGWVF